MAKIELKLFVQAKCPKCPEAKAIARELTEKRNDVELKILDIGDQENYLSALMLQISSTPAFTVGDTVLFVADNPTVNELSEKLDEYAKRM
ncbi:MAG: thioredoxin family protein [archaeon]